MRELDCHEIGMVSGAGLTIAEARNAVNSLSASLAFASETIPNAALKNLARNFAEQIKEAGNNAVTKLESLYKKTEDELKSNGEFMMRYWEQIEPWESYRRNLYNSDKEY